MALNKQSYKARQVVEIEEGGRFTLRNSAIPRYSILTVRDSDGKGAITHLLRSELEQLRDAINTQLEKIEEGLVGIHFES